MGTLKQDYIDWTKAKAEAKRCADECARYQQDIATDMSYDEFLQYNIKTMDAKMSVVVDKSITEMSDYADKMIEALKKVQMGACFTRIYKWYPVIGKVEIGKDLCRCINNFRNGMVYKDFCDGCPKYKELVESQRLVSDVMVAREKQNVAKMMLMNHFRIFNKIK